MATSPTQRLEYRAARQLLHLSVQIHRSAPQSAAAQDLLTSAGRLLTLLVGATWEADPSTARDKLRLAQETAEDVVQSLFRLRRRGRASLPHLLAADEVCERLRAAVERRLGPPGPQRPPAGPAPRADGS